MPWISCALTLSILFQPYDYNQDVHLPSSRVRPQENASQNYGNVTKMKTVKMEVMRKNAVSF